MTADKIWILVRQGFVDTLYMTIPSTLLAISIVAALGQGMANLMIAMCISQVPKSARIVRSSILSVKGQEFIEASKCFGGSDPWVIVKHVLPNAIGPLIVQTTANVSSMILSAATLSFLGLGIDPPQPEWGALVSEAQEFLRRSPHLLIFPGILICVASFSMSVLGDGLRDALDPKQKR